jgi:hypothetical protein
MRPPHFAIKFMANRNKKRILYYQNNSQKVQELLLLKIIKLFKKTALGEKFKLSSIHNISDFNNIIPITVDTDYDEHSKVLKESNPPNWVQAGKLKYLARTSGSTAASKYIYYTDDLVKNFKRYSTNLFFHFSSIVNRYDLLDQNVLVSPANPNSEDNDQGIIIGYAAGIMTMLAPKFSRKIVKPSLEILSLPTLGDKVAAMAKESTPLDIRSFSSVPSFALAILEGIFTEAKAMGMNPKTIKDIWPNFSIYMYSGSSVAPYEKKLRKYLGDDIPLLEIYSATESPIAYQYGLKKNELILDLDSAYFQFQVAGSNLDSTRLGVHEVETGVQYRLLMTTYGGLMCYRIGDIIEFTDAKKCLIKVIGREKEELNIAGTERLSLEVVRDILNSGCDKFQISYDLFFLAPYYDDNEEKGYHWCLETEQADQDKLNLLATFLDQETIKRNSGYKLSRDSNSRLTIPKVTALKPGSIDQYILNNKQFGQGKFLTIHNTVEEPNRFFDYYKVLI